MPSLGAIALVAGGAMSAFAAVAHLACIAIGAPAYRVMGASDRMIRAAEKGKAWPALITLFIAMILFLWAGYAWAGAGVIASLPLSKLALTAICAVYLVRAIAFPFLKPVFPANTQTFWLVSSGICLVIGLFHLVGIIELWGAL
ncbi:hypothetical protein [Comamonas sp.]|uniref:hypothetical protein n=1 Tax=Comamonas sp. TaxID=34028 RepID=UPI00264A47F0|nr:hypothetical protein [Comamonas sp.]